MNSSNKEIGDIFKDLVEGILAIRETTPSNTRIIFTAEIKDGLKEVNERISKMRRDMKYEKRKRIVKKLLDMNEE